MDALLAALRGDGDLTRVVDEIERLHRVVFHGNRRADWSLVRQSAEQILIAEIVSRHQGHVDGAHAALRNLQAQGQDPTAALRTLAANVHSYYTTPLGIVMRQDLFGDDVVFLTPDALGWTSQVRGRPVNESA